jgi:NAD(P)-dependent dehydrogenase (short-subunit alcohol dehydrogenase family)
VKEAADRMGGIDIIVNNAAPGRNRDAVHALSGSDWKDHERIVLSGAVNLIDAAKEMLSKDRSGAVVNISSVVAASVSVGGCSWPYHASKAGLEHLTRWLAVKLGPDGIRVNAVSPGLIDREGWEERGHDQMRTTLSEQIIPLGTSGSPKDNSNAVLFLCSGYSKYMTGQVLTVDGGLNLWETYASAARIYNHLQR